MMQSIITALYNGNPPPAGAGFQNNIDYGDLHSKMKDLVESLKMQLDEEDHKKIEDLEYLHGDRLIIEIDQGFRHGFCIGALLMIEIFTAENLVSKSKGKQTEGDSKG